MPIDIGALQYLIEIQRPVTAADGCQTTSWATVDTVCGSLEPLTYRESIQASALTESLGSAVTIYWRSDVSVTYRLLVDGRTLMIQSAQDPTGEREMLRLVCTEVQS
jgi:SPP1 family predicted phage head-tail adaptor